MIVYVVVCNGKLSSIGYKTFQEAQNFCEKRYGNPKKIDNGCKYENGNDLYVIQDVQVEEKND